MASAGSDKPKGKYHEDAVTTGKAAAWAVVYDEKQKEPFSLGKALCETIAFIKQKWDILMMSGEELNAIAFHAAHEVVEHKSTIYYWAVFKRAAMLAVFIGFFVFYFKSFYITSTFLALDEEAGTCHTLGKDYSGVVFKADRNGNWLGNPAYSPVKAVYQLSLFGFHTDSEKVYEQFMENIAKAIDAIGELSSKKDLAFNLLLWASWTYKAQMKGEAQQTVILTGDPAFIMANEGNQGTASSVNGDCSLLKSSQTYAMPTFSTTFDISQVQCDASCYGPNGAFSDIGLADRMGYDPTVNGNTWSIALDTHSLYSALAVSHLINGPSSLNAFSTIVNVSTAVWYLDGKSYTLIDKYDPNYPGMSPITCVGPTYGVSAEYNCFLRVGKSYGIPFMKHAGKSADSGIQCDCEKADGFSPLCNQLNLLFGLIVYDYKRYAPADHDGSSGVARVNTAVSSSFVFTGHTSIVNGVNYLIVSDTIYGAPHGFPANLPLSLATTLYDSNGKEFYFASGTCVQSNPCSADIAVTTCSQYKLASTTTTYPVGSVFYTADTLPTISSSKILIVSQTVSGTVGNNMRATFLETGATKNTTTTLRNCNIKSGVGYCILEAPVKVERGTILHAVSPVSSTIKEPPGGVYDVSVYPEKFQPVLPLLEVFYAPPPITAKEANDFAYYPAYSAIKGQKCTASSCAPLAFATNSTSRRSWYTFTDTYHFGTGTLFTWNTFSDLQVSITADNLQLQNGACSNAISLGEAAFKKLVKTPFGPLIEIYYKCTYSLTDAVLNALGIATGTAGLLVPGLFFIMFGLAVAAVALKNKLLGKTVINHDFDEYNQELGAFNTSPAKADDRALDIMSISDRIPTPIK